MKLQAEAEEELKKKDPALYELFKSAQENGRLVEQSRILEEMKQMFDDGDIPVQVASKLLKLFKN